jgi:hypothetical protein
LRAEAGSLEELLRHGPAFNVGEKEAAVFSNYRGMIP